MILTKDEVQNDRDVRIAREMEIDPNFEPCRDERCERLELHRAHRIVVSRKPRRSHCPKCQTAVEYRRREDSASEFAFCPGCQWRGYSMQVKEET